jgi:hypothetical protein
VRIVQQGLSLLFRATRPYVAWVPKVLMPAHLAFQL